LTREEWSWKLPALFFPPTHPDLELYSTWDLFEELKEAALWLEDKPY
jgi:hypothetical protein